MSPSCHPLFYTPNVSQQTETIRCDRLASALETHNSFPSQPVLAIACCMYVGKSPLSLPSQPSTDVGASSRRLHPGRPYDTRLCWRKSPQYAHLPAYSLRGSHPHTVVQDFSTFPGCYAASVPAIIAGYWSASRLFPNFFTLYSISTRAGLRPSSSRVGYKSPHLPSVLTAITRCTVCSRDVESVCLVERSVCRSPHLDHDGIFQ